MRPAHSLKMNLIIFLIALLSACSKQSNENITDTIQELEYKSEHFHFRLTEFDHATIASIARHLENNYSRVANDLNASTLPLINIQFYSDHSALHRALNISNGPSWLVGNATAPDQIHMMSPQAPNLNRAFDEMLAILVHEFTHCVTLNMVSSNNVPRWLWEGVALYEAGQFVHPNRIPYLVNGNPPTLVGLNANWQTNTQVYEVGYLLVEYLVETWGKERLVNLIKARGDIQSVLGVSIAAFEAGWYEFVNGKYL